MGLTHIFISLAGTTALLGTTDPSVMLIAAISSQLPDIDTTKSFAGRVVYPLARFLEERFPHRSLTHSLLFTLAIALLGIPIIYFFSLKHWLALPLSHAISSIADTFTKSGARLFYPNRVICVAGANPRLRLATGTTPEYFVLAIALALWILALNIISDGGLEKQFSIKFLTNNQTAVELLRQENQKAIALVVRGTRKIDNSQVNERYWAIGASGNVLIVRSNSGQVLRVGEGGEIIPTRVDVLSDRLTIKIKRQRIKDSLAEKWIDSLSNNALVVGTLQMEDSQDLELPIPTPGMMQTVTRSGDSVNLDHASPEDLRSLHEFFILSGEVLIKQL